MANNSEDAIDFSKTLLGKDPIGPLSKLLWECQREACKSIANRNECAGEVTQGA